MSQWGQQPQQGYQYPLQTGFQGANPQFQQSSQFQQNPQFLQQNPGQFQQQPQGFQQTQLGPQPTGFPGQRPGFQQPQQTGFPGASPSFLQSQPTGYPAGNSFQQSRIPPVPPLPGQFQNAQNNNFMGLPGQQQQQQPQPPQQINRYVSSSPGFAAPPPIPSQPPAFRSAPLVPQATGFIDPRLQMMSTTFMPTNVSSPYGAGGMPQLGPQQLQGGLNLQQSFQQHNQAQRGTVAPKISWALSKAEKKNYDSIFRAWDTQGTGFINGQTALEVFGQSGLDKNDLAKIWFVLVLVVLQISI
jgi:actin cytoskeleton-regulatory complex protein PAN1